MLFIHLLLPEDALMKALMDPEVDGLNNKIVLNFVGDSQESE